MPERERETMNHYARIDAALIASARSNAAHDAYIAARDANADDDVLLSAWDAFVVASRAAYEAWNAARDAETHNA